MHPKHDSLILQALRGEITPRIPFWFMRQAGRYLPEYRAVRATTSGFLDLCFSPEKAAEVTLQPLRRFGMDAAILFSDILVIPHALGASVRFTEGEGPQITPTDTPQKIAALDLGRVEAALAPIAQTVQLVQAQLSPATALIGFAGGPWTVACYMLQGRSGKEFQTARSFALAQPELMQSLIDILCEATIIYLRQQIAAGADVLQLFDSWAGLLTPPQFARWVSAPSARIAAALRQSHPHIPLIGFPKGAGENLASYARETQVQAIGVDQQMSLSRAIALRAHPQQAVQGNLDPLAVACHLPSALAQTEEILLQLREVPAIFNLGHGFIPATPIEHVTAIAQKVQAWRR